MTKTKRIYAVLTGDVVGSSHLTPKDLKLVMQRLRSGATRLGETFPGATVGELAVFSGDGWQLLMPDWRKSLRAALFLRAVVKGTGRLKADTRVAIGWGTVDLATLDPKRISEATGEAFTRSGRALDAMRKHERMALVPDGPTEPEAGRLLAASMRLLDELASRWKPAQAKAVALALLGHPQEDIARELKVSPPAVTKVVQATGWRAMEEFLEETEVNPKRLIIK